jgi:hypothetical protein
MEVVLRAASAIAGGVPMLGIDISPTLPNSRRPSLS